MQLDLIKLLVIAISIAHTTQAEDKWQNASQICRNKCNCVSRDDIFTLDCSNKDITKVLSDWPDDITNETTVEVHFTWNHINRLDALPGSNLTFVVFYNHCNITELGSGLFENCVNVKYMDLSYNQLKAEQLHSDVFKGPYSNTNFQPIALEHLNLAYNKEIHSLEKNLFEHIPNLKRLNLEGNGFRIIDGPTMQSFKLLKKLEHLNLAQNRFVQLPDELLKPLISLNVLDISENELSFLPTSVLQVSRTLRKLILDGNEILEFNDDTFLGMETLVEISARNLKELRQIGTNAFSPLRNLRKLDLSGMNGTANIEDEAIGNGTKLRELNLSRSNLYKIPRNLVNWTQLTVLDLRKNPLHCDCSLINITNSLTENVKRDQDRAYCYDIVRHRQHDVYTLSEDVCLKAKLFREKQSYGMKIMRVSLLMLSVILLVIAGLATIFCYKRVLSQRSSRLNTFATKVVYNPIITNRNM